VIDTRYYNATHREGTSENWSWQCGSNDFQDYFDDAKESRVKQVPKNQESKSFKNQVSKNQDSRIIKFQDSIKFQESRFKNNQDRDSRIKRRLNQDKY